MSRMTIARYVDPWKFRREQNEQRLAALRRRDGDNCTRCRRALRFDLPAGHDMGVRIEEIVPGSAAGTETLDNLCLCHRRCNAKSGDDTQEVQQRVRLRCETALFESSRSRRSA